jgi:hypothetical protein
MSTVTLVLVLEMCAAVLLVWKTRKTGEQTTLQSTFAFFISASATFMLATASSVLVLHYTDVGPNSNILFAYAWIALAAVGFATAGISGAPLSLIMLPCHLVAIGCAVCACVWRSPLAGFTGLSVLIFGVGVLWASRRLSDGFKTTKPLKA